MMYTCAKGCANLGHRHISQRSLFSDAHDRAAPARRAAPKKPSARQAASARTMKNAKGRGLRVDIHCHYLNVEVAARVASLRPMDHEPLHIYSNPLTHDVNARQMKERGEMLTSIEIRLRDMDKMGIDIQAVSPAPFQYYYWTEPELGAELARQINDRIAGVAASRPDRFVGIGTVPLQDADFAVTELERMVNELGMHGVEINTNVNGLDLTDKKLRLEKFFRKAQELDTVIFLHPMGFTQAERLCDHYFNNVIGNPMDTTIAASHLIFDGVMKRNAKLKIVLAHGGGYLAHYPGRMDHAHSARKDCRVEIKSSPTSYLKKMYFDTITFDPAMLRFMVDYYGADHVLLGTDYPYDMGDFDPIGSVKAIPKITGVEKELIMGANAAKLLKIRA
jgi:aminocarboxymuconate-semialdehyde decarboxylase